MRNYANRNSTITSKSFGRWNSDPQTWENTSDVAVGVPLSSANARPSWYETSRSSYNDEMDAVQGTMAPARCLSTDTRTFSCSKAPARNVSAQTMQVLKRARE